MLDLFHVKKDIPFMRWARSTIFVSIAFILASIVLLATKGLNLGVDFTGGTVMEVGYPAAANIPAVREHLARNGYGDAQVQNFGTSTEVLVRLHWRGARMVEVPTRVTYPRDGQSHFRLWRDNVRISAMHARLFFGMLRRLPTLLRRRHREVLHA